MAKRHGSSRFDILENTYSDADARAVFAVIDRALDKGREHIGFDIEGTTPRTLFLFFPAMGGCIQACVPDVWRRLYANVAGIGVFVVYTPEAGRLAFTTRAPV